MPAIRIRSTARAMRLRQRVRSFLNIQFGVLTSLARNPEMTQGNLARAVLMTPQSLGEMLRGLVSRGLVSRQDGVGRGHSIHVTITAQGSELLSRATPLVSEMNRPAELGLTGAEADRLHALLRKVLSSGQDVIGSR